MASTLTLREIIDPLRTYSELSFLSGVAGFTNQPALNIANRVMQRFLARNMPWKFNRAQAPGFLAIQLQQDYVTNITDLSWLERGWRIDVNNTARPKPMFGTETIRDQAPSSTQANPFNPSWIPNALATMGAWQANTLYSCPYGNPQQPAPPINQFKDRNGNILFIDSSALKLSLNSPGYSGGVVSTPAPFGTSGATEPYAASGAAGGVKVADGTITWTVADPNGIAFRLNPIPPNSGLAWLIELEYQKKPPLLTSLADKLTPIPDEFMYLFQDGFLAYAYFHARDEDARKKAPTMLTLWEQALQIAIASGDRERDNSILYPSESITGIGPMGYGMPIGPAYPFELPSF